MTTSEFDQRDQRDPRDYLFAREIRQRIGGLTDRAFRGWLTAGRFPPPDLNLAGANAWLRSTYETWQRDALAGKYRLVRHGPSQRRTASESAA